LRNHSLDGAETWKTAGAYRRRLVSDMAFLQWLHRANPAAFPASGALLPKTLIGFDRHRQFLATLPTVRRSLSR
jgi:hypothetical protein